jgi:hypothetical protein
MQKNTSSYDYKVYKKVGTILTEISDFDFSDLESKGNFEKNKYVYLHFPFEDFIEGYSCRKAFITLAKAVLPYAMLRIVYNSKKNNLN